MWTIAARIGLARLQSCIKKACRFISKLLNFSLGLRLRKLEDCPRRFDVSVFVGRQMKSRSVVVDSAKLYGEPIEIEAAETFKALICKERITGVAPSYRENAKSDETLV